MNNQGDNIFLIDDTEELEKVPLVNYENENLIQTLIEKYPEILAGDQMGEDEPVKWLLVKREAGIPDGDEVADRWSADHLLLDQNAVPTIVEVKRSSDTRIRREVVGQMIEYAANAARYWPQDRIRALAVEQYGGNEEVDNKISGFLGLNPDEDNKDAIKEFWAQVESNLQNGKVRLLFVADSLPRELHTIIEFLNEKMRDVYVIGVELRQYVGGRVKILVPRVIGLTERIKQVKSGGGTPIRHIDREQFLAACSNDVREFFDEALTEAERRGLIIYWGTKGFSLRINDQNGDIQTYFYGFPPGAHGSSTAFIEGYLPPPIRETLLGQSVRKRFLSIHGFRSKGKYTLNLPLTKESIKSANQSMEIIWDIAQKIGQR